MREKAKDKRKRERARSAQIFMQVHTHRPSHLSIALFFAFSHGPRCPFIDGWLEDE